jgi:DNA-binding NarL/FixJ family response regulator
VTIVVADDHEVVRVGVRRMLEAEPDLRVVGEAKNGFEVLPAVERLQPDVLVLDLVMPGLNGVEVIRQVMEAAPETRIVVLSMHANEAYVVDSLRHGAAAYVLKGSDGTLLLEAIRAVLAGNRYLSPPLSEGALKEYIEKAEGAPEDPFEALTARERQVLQLAAEGHTNTGIADRLGISRRTVETHRANLSRKLGFRSQSDLVRYALQRGVVRLDS